jgi:RNA polymerase sigma-70 factor (ECF subfamily)
MRRSLTNLTAISAATKRTTARNRQTPGTNSTPICHSENWSNLVAQIKVGDHAGMEQLYRLFGRGIRFYLCRHLKPQDLDDRVHDAFLIVVRAIQNGDLREPNSLMGFVRTVVRRQVAAYIQQAILTRRELTDLEGGVAVADRADSPEQQTIVMESTRLVQESLTFLSPKDREILIRFYLKEQPQDQICREMLLTETQFRLGKSRAKARLGEIGRKKLVGRETCGVFMQAQAS